MFRATMCPSSGEITVSIRHLVFVTVCGWPSGMQGGMKCFLLCMFISILYMFRASMCPSSGEITVSIRHLLFVTLCGWPSGMQSGMKLHFPSTQSDKYQLSYWYSYFSWWWAHICPKHVENRNEHTKKEFCTRLVLFTRLNRPIFDIWIILNACCDSINILGNSHNE
jgi:hypothetical protein